MKENTLQACVKVARGLFGFLAAISLTTQFLAQEPMTSSPTYGRDDTVSLEAEGQRSHTCSLVDQARGALRYNMVQQKSSHNSFAKDEDILSQLVDYHIRSLEFDIHETQVEADPTNPRIIRAPPQDWFVRHNQLSEGVGFEMSPTCETLSECLSLLSTFHRMRPDHEIVTVWIDLKSDWSGDLSHSPFALDQAILGEIPSSAIFGPRSIMDRCSIFNLRRAVQDSECGWPTLDELTGKFIFVLTGGEILEADSKLNRYVANGSLVRSRLAFIAPGPFRAADYAIFYNIGLSESRPTEFAQNLNSIITLRQAGFVTRSYTLNQSFQWQWARERGSHHLATDNINFHRDPWATTHASDGWPFTSLDSDDDGYSDYAEVFMGTDPNRSCGVAAWPPDFTGDGAVDFVDVVLFANAYDSSLGDRHYDARADLTADCKVDFTDFVRFADAFEGRCPR